MPILNRPLRVMHIISGDLWAGAEVQAFTLLSHLHTAVQLHVVIMNHGELAQRLQSLNIPVTLLLESNHGSLDITREIARLIRSFKPDVLHTHRRKENILSSIANCMTMLLTGKYTKSVRTSHGAPEFIPAGKQRIQIWLDNWTGRFLQHAIIAVSQELASQLVNIFPEKKIHVIRNGVDRAALLAQAGEADFLTRAPHHKHIGIVGRIEPVKRIDIFLDMAAMLMNQISESQAFKFHIIGDGKLRATMELKVKQLGLTENIYFHGHRQDMASCIKSLDIMVMCSDHEGTPMSALEAMAVGTPLVAHDTGGLTDILQDYPALLVANHSPEGYAEKVSKLLSKNKVVVSLNEKYTAHRNFIDTLSLYKKL
ncbi:MAG: glycosyltransferase [Pseudomonadota bacterium]